MSDRYNIQAQLEHLRAKQVGTGHPDIEPHEWMVNQHRDTYCTYLGRQDMMSYFAVVEGESKTRLRFNYLKKLLQPCGPPPVKSADLPCIAKGDKVNENNGS